MKIDALLPAIPEAVHTPPREPEDKTLGLGSIIKQVRERRGVTQAQLAVAAQLERTSITNIERGTQRLQLSTLALIAEALDMELIVRLQPKSAAALAKEAP